MSIAAIVRIGISTTGFLIMGLTFYLHAVKKLTVNLAVAWEGIGIGLVLVGAIPVLSSWCYLIGEGTVVAMFLVGAVAVWSGYELSVQISSLSLKTQELAMQVSLLNQENERMLKALSELTGKMCEISKRWYAYEKEKSIICNQYTGKSWGRGGSTIAIFCS